MTIAIIQIIVFQFVLPAMFLYSLWKGSFHSKVEWLIQSAFTVLFVTWVFFSSSWDWFGYYLRFIWLFLLLFVIYTTWKKSRDLPFRIPFNRNQKWSIGIYVVLSLVFGVYNVFIFSGYTPEDQAIELEFPLKNGVYYVGQGGDHVHLNYHNAYPDQKYAVDIVKLNMLGIRASGVYPEQLNKYFIYGDELSSPCGGEIVASRDQLPDLTPPETDPEHPKGNYVKINCENNDADIYIAHMKEGSLTVEEGDTVQEGQAIGLVGNSGNTSEPHLHIHAEQDGEGVPIRFNGRFLVRNSVVW